MQVHQIFTDTLGTLKYRNLSCFCNRGFCLCQNPKVYEPIEKVSETVSAESSDEEALVDFCTKKVSSKVQTYYNTVYSDSSDFGNEPFAKYKRNSHTKNIVEASTSYNHENQSVGNEILHPTKISEGVYVLVNICSDKNKNYTYLGMSLSTVDEDGDVKIMFFKAIGDNVTIFRAVQKDVSYEPFENIKKIVPQPKKKLARIIRI